MKSLSSSTSMVLRLVRGALYDLPAPSNLTTLWNFGSLLGLCLVVQLLSGFFLSMHYLASTSLAFDSLSHIQRDVSGGWLIRAMHVNTASLFFFCVYLHIGRGFYFGSYLLKGTWFTGVFLLLLLIATSFLGYVLPWGQISFWGATVITNLLSALPYFGRTIVTWLWGGFSVDAPTLRRFISFHFLLPILLVLLAGVHICFLHDSGSSNPLGISSESDKVPFHRYYVLKDFFGFALLTSVLCYLVFMEPNYFLESVNFSPANPIVTPPHIVPEWYFLFAYAILRVVPSKLGGVFALLSAVCSPLFLAVSPTSKMKSLSYYGPVKLYFWFFVFNFLLLTQAGSWPIVLPYSSLTSLFSISFFAYFLINPLLKYAWDIVIYE